jgi:hypothetical protein
LLVCRVIRVEESYLCVAKNRHDASNASSTPRNDAHVVGGVLALLSFPVEVVVIFGYFLAEFPDANCGCVLDLIEWDVEVEAAGRCAFNRTSLGSSLVVSVTQTRETVIVNP